MRKLIATMCAGALLAVGIAAPAAAYPPQDVQNLVCAKTDKAPFCR